MVVSIWIFKYPQQIVQFCQCFNNPTLLFSLFSFCRIYQYCANKLSVAPSKINKLCFTLKSLKTLLQIAKKKKKKILTISLSLILEPIDWATNKCFSHLKWYKLRKKCGRLFFSMQFCEYSSSFNSFFFSFALLYLWNSTV